MNKMKGLLPSRVSAVCIIAALAACAGVEQRPPEVRTTTVGVPYEVPTPCFEKSDLPTKPLPTPVADGATEDQKDAAIQADALAWKDYGLSVDILFLKCLKSSEVKP